MIWYDMMSLSKKCWLLPWCVAFCWSWSAESYFDNAAPPNKSWRNPSCARARASVWWHKRRCTADLVLSRNQGNDVRKYGPPKKNWWNFCPLRELSLGNPFPFSHSQNIRHWDGAGCRSRIGVSYEMLSHCSKTTTVKNTYPPGNWQIPPEEKENHLQKCP